MFNFFKSRVSVRTVFLYVDDDVVYTVKLPHWWNEETHQVEVACYA